MKIYVMEVDDILKDIIPKGIDVKVVDYNPSIDNTNDCEITLYGVYSIDSIKLPHLVNRTMNILINSESLFSVYMVSTLFIKCTIEAVEIRGDKIKMILHGECEYNAKVDEAYNILEQGEIEPLFYKQSSNNISTKEE